MRYVRNLFLSYFKYFKAVFDYFFSSHRSDISTGSRRGVGTVDVGALALSGAASPSGAGSPKAGVYMNNET